MNYAPELAGVGRYSGDIGEYLAERGHDVCVITTPPHYPGWTRAETSHPFAWTRERLGSADVYRCPLYLHPNMQGLRRLLSPLSFALTSLPVVLLQCAKRRPHIIIVVEPTLAIAPAALVAARLIGAKTILHVQDLELEAAFALGHVRTRGPVARLARLANRLLVRRFGKVIAISARMASAVIAKGVPSARVRVVRNWVDLSKIAPMPISTRYRAELGLEPSDFVVLYSGSIGAKQGVGVLLEATRILAGNRNIVFVIAGRGPLQEQVARAAQTQRNIKFVDLQPEERFGEFLSIADAHILPQDRAAADLVLPSKLGGMLASGRPILVTADPDTELAEFLGGSCQLIPPGDPNAIAEATLAMSMTVAEASATEARLALAANLAKDGCLRQFAAVLFDG